MKKALCCILSFVICITLCGCNVLSELSSAFTEFLTDSDYGQIILMDEKVEAYKIDPHPIDDNEIAFLYCYQQLDKEQKRIYKLIYSAVEKMQKGWIELGISRDSFSSDVAIAYQALNHDHPELFWMPYTYLLSSTEKSGSLYAYIALSHSKDGYSCNYLIDADALQSMKNEFESKISEILSEAKGKSLYESELIFHDYLCRNTEYIKESEESLVYTAYGALVNGTAVCEGYSRAMQVLCKRAGIPCVLITGTAQGENHMWNLIDPGDGWYHTDVTWDDTAVPLYSSYIYFNLNDTDISATHSPAVHYSKLKTDTISLKNIFNILDIRCVKNEYNYFEHEDLILSNDSANKTAQRILLASADGNIQLQMKFEDTVVATKFKNDYNEAVALIQDELYSIAGRKAPVIDNITLTDSTVSFYWQSIFD